MKKIINRPMTEAHKLKISIANTGKTKSVEAREKMRAKKLGKKQTSEQIEARRKSVLKAIAEGRGMKGKTHSLEARRKMSITRQGRTPWNKGLGNKSTEVQKIRSSKEYRLWREAVFKRDNYTCIWCYQIGGKLNADHIKKFAHFPELRFAIDNGRTLCEPCHKTTDTFGNKKTI